MRDNAAGLARAARVNADGLRRLLATYWERLDDLPDRVTRALHRAEFSVWTRQADLAIPLIVAEEFSDHFTDKAIDRLFDGRTLPDFS